MSQPVPALSGSGAGERFFEVPLGKILNSSMVTQSGEHQGAGTEIIWRSQFGQDKWLMENIFNYKRGGFFLDCGCNDPINISNTYVMESEFDWSGIGIDLQISQNFPAARPRTIPFQACLSSKAGSIVDIVPGGGTTGINNDSSNDHIRKNLFSSGSYKTITTTLTQVLDACSAPKDIDFFSLDVEGHEISILEGLDRDRYSIDYICVETPYSKIIDDNTVIQVGGGRDRFFGYMAYIGYTLIKAPIPSDTIWRLNR